MFSMLEWVREHGRDRPSEETMQTEEPKRTTTAAFA